MAAAMDRQKNSLHRVSPAAWVGGGLFLTAALTVRYLSGSPLPLLHSLGDTPCLPPLWVTGLMFLSSFFLLGCAAGGMLQKRGGGPAREIGRLRGELYCLLGTAAALGWYPLLFASAALWLSMPVLLSAVSAAVVCALAWMPCSRCASLAATGCALEWLALSVMQFLTVIGR